ncbi:hypothetical protein G4B88_012426 [Cannabis sativa]|uniref:Uncharacterized protein n=1 Tax=Cannabis sativa TaxID=3483 RepID=A0A7J6I6F1_CANSA|nr:hypothetical protein G4B88_012426 [Cannabis sativa]
MQSWIGVKARSTVPLNYDDWRHVDSKLKGKIWKDTYMHLEKFKSKTNISSNAIFGGLSQYFEDDHLLPLRQQWLNNV